MLKSAQGHLNWSALWSSPGEGPFTRVAKLSIANPSSPTALQRWVTGTAPTNQASGAGRHSRTLLDSAWFVRSLLDGASPFRQELQDATLHKVLGAWTFSVAGDEAMRYCPTCLQHGYQSSLCQIEALRSCPVHGDPLRTSCPHCKTRMPRYAWDNRLSSAQFTMRCTHCAKPFGRAWEPSTHLRWRPMPGAERYEELARQLCVFRDIRRIEVDGWQALFRAGARPAQRLYEFSLLQSASSEPLNADVGRWAEHIVDTLQMPIDVELSNDFDYRALWMGRRGLRIQSAFRRVARNVAASQPRGRRGAEDTTPSWDYPEGFRFPEVVAQDLFRLRYRSMVGALGYPPSAVLGLTSRQWRHFFEACHAAELRYAKQLRNFSKHALKGSERWQAILSFHGEGLKARQLCLPFGAAALRINSGGEAKVHLAFGKLPSLFGRES